MGTYKHTQVGYVILVSMGLAAALCVALNLWTSDAGPPLLIAAAILIICGVLFASMTIEIRGGRLRWRFSPGLIRKSVALDQIESVKLWQMHGLGGWGIHWTREGWLYNVSGRQGVHVILKTGKQFILGSDEPETLCATMQAALRDGQP